MHKHGKFVVGKTGRLAISPNTDAPQADNLNSLSWAPVEDLTE